jgi:hypothetical protein
MTRSADLDIKQRAPAIGHLKIGCVVSDGQPNSMLRLVYGRADTPKRRHAVDER